MVKFSGSVIRFGGVLPRGMTLLTEWLLMVVYIAIGVPTGLRIRFRIGPFGGWSGKTADFRVYLRNIRAEHLEHGLIVSS